MRKCYEFALALTLAAALPAGCGDERAPAPAAKDAVHARFTITIDPQSASLDGPTLEPRAGAATVTGDSPTLRLSAHVARMPLRPEIVWVELFVENLAHEPLEGVVARLSGDASVSDFTNNSYEAPAPAPQQKVLLGGIAARGVGRAALGVPSGGPVEIVVDIEALEGKSHSTSSAPLTFTPDGREVWIAVPDTSEVAVVDAQTEAREALIPVGGGPSSVAAAGDDLLLVTSPKTNTVSVLDRKARAVVQSFGEADGIGREPEHVVVSPDGQRAFVSAYVGDRITALRRKGDRFEVEGSTAVGRRPTAMSVSPDGRSLFVAHYLPRGRVTENEGFISVLATEPLSVLREVVLLDHYNVDEVKCLTDLFGAAPEKGTWETAPTQLAGVFLSPGGSEGWVPGSRVAGLPVWERGPNAQVLSPLVAPNPGELASTFTFLFDTRAPEQTERLLLPADPERPYTSVDYARCALLGAEIEMSRSDPVPGEPDQIASRLPAAPTGIAGLGDAGMMRFVAFTRAGRRALLLSYASDEITVIDATTHHPAAIAPLTLSGANPTGLAVSPDGKKAYVTYANSLFASVLDLSAYADDAALPPPGYVPYEFRVVPELPPPAASPSADILIRHVGGLPAKPEIVETGQVQLASKDPMDPVMRRGRTLFSSSNGEKYPGLTQSRLGACESCHPRGGADGSMWATMEGERRTMSLRGGVAGRGWLHASATHIDAAEFVHTVVTERFGGSLGPEDEQALALYLAKGIATLQSPPVDEALAAEGKAIFATHCAGCHGGEKLTSGAPDPQSPLGGGLEAGPWLYDVGSATDDALVNLGPLFTQFFPEPERTLTEMVRGDRDLGPGDPLQAALDFRQRPPRPRGSFKAPSLVNVWDQVLFMHDGRESDLAGAVRFIAQSQGLELSDGEVAAVVEYLRTL